MNHVSSAKLLHGTGGYNFVGYAIISSSKKFYWVTVFSIVIRSLQMGQCSFR